MEPFEQSNEKLWLHPVLLSRPWHSAGYLKGTALRFSLLKSIWVSDLGEGRLIRTTFFTTPLWMGESHCWQRPQVLKCHVGTPVGLHTGWFKPRGIRNQGQGQLPGEKGLFPHSRNLLPLNNWLTRRGYALLYGPHRAPWRSGYKRELKLVGYCYRLS